MQRARDEILQDALVLPPEERAMLAGSLIESLDEDVDVDVATAWEDEIVRRIAELDSGAVRLVPWTEARRRIGGR